MTTRTQPAGASRTAADGRPQLPDPAAHAVVARRQPIPAEQYAEDTSYVVRFELPGVDPGRDLHVSVTTGTLTVAVERRDSAPASRQTEFRYGSFVRHIALPLGANVHEVSASYHNGILTVRVGLQPDHQAGARAIDVTVEP